MCFWARGEIMPGMFFYIFWFVFALVGALVFARVFVPARSAMARYDVIRQNRRRALSLVGFSAMIVGLLSFIDTYAERHALAEGVIFIPRTVMLWTLMVALMCGFIGVLWLVGLRSRRTKAKRTAMPEQESTPEDDSSPGTRHVALERN